MKIQSLFLRPIKSMQVINVERAKTCDTGLLGDSLFCLIDEHDKFVSLRTHPKLTDFKLRISRDVKLTVYPGKKLPFFELLLQPGFYSGTPFRIEIWEDLVEVCEVTPSLSSMFSDYLRQRVKLVTVTNNNISFISRPRYTRAGQTARALQDGYNISLINSASLEKLEKWAGCKISPKCFRSNIIMSSQTPFIEDFMVGKRIKIGDLIFRVIEHIPRCNIINQNHKTGLAENNLVKILAEKRPLCNPHNLIKKIVPFGVGLTLIGDNGSIHTGDSIKILD